MVLKGVNQNITKVQNLEIALGSLQKQFDDFLQLPVETKNSKASWFSIPLTIRENAGFNRTQLVSFLEKANIETRPLLGGNVLKQPAYKNIKYRSTEMKNTDYFHENSFYVGCHQGLTAEMIDYMFGQFDTFFKTIK